MRHANRAAAAGTADGRMIPWTMRDNAADDTPSAAGPQLAEARHERRGANVSDCNGSKEVEA
jgi:hypothetical protein